MRSCGPQRGPLRYIPVPYRRVFEAACAVHDYDYTRGGSSKDRRTADQHFFTNMIRTIVNRYPRRPYTMLWMAVFAMHYYWMVRLFGVFYFNKTN